MRLAKVLFVCTVILAFSDQLCAQGTSAQFKVRESKLFGLKGERFARFELTSQDRAIPLSSEKVNAGQYYYFLFQPVGDWTLDPDFLQEELPKLILLQNNQTMQIGWKTDVFTDSAGTSILVGYPKDLKLYELFTVQFGLDGATSKADLKIPQEFWPGYSILTGALKEADKATAEKKHRDAITIYGRLMRADSLQIFPQSRDLGQRRSSCFESIVNDTWLAFLEAIRAQTAPLKEKISEIDHLTPHVQFVLDSLPSVSLKISALDSSAKPLLEHAKDILVKVKATRDSLQRAQDDLTVKWISEGAATGKNGPQFERIIEILAYAFSSLDFADTTSRPLTVSISAELQGLLLKNNLQESFDIFIRQSSERFQKRLSLFPAGFLSNLQKDTASFSLPFYSMLKAIQGYYSRANVSALEAIRSVFRTCHDPELSRRFDQLRVLINLRMRGNRPEIMSLFDEAAAAEKAGDNDLASERYTTALRLAPEMASAAYLCGKLFLRAGDAIRARSFFERAYDIDSCYLSAYRDAWTLYQTSGNYKAMIDVLTRAISRGNDFWETNINLGIAYLGDGDLPQAIRQFERALDLNPHNYQTNVQLGLAYQTAKDFQKAREYYNKAIFIDPHRLEAVEFLQKLDELQKAGR